eukprot:s86_g22.t1
MVPRKLSANRQIRFSQAVELYVGSELDLAMTSWPHRLEMSHLQASIFHHDEDEDDDAASFMANFDPGLQPVQDRPDVDRLLDHPTAVQQEDDVPMTDDDEASSVSESWPQIDRNVPNWQTTMIFALNRQATTLRLDWHDYEGLHASIARELRVVPADLFHLHHVRYPPQDLFRAHVEPVIAQRAFDVPPGSTERLVLLDVEFHSARPATVPDVVRQARKLIHPLTKVQLLDQLGLQQYCQQARPHPCLIWNNNNLIPLSETYLDLRDGDYLRIAIPPGCSRLDHVDTRCLATAYFRGMTPADILDQHTLHLLGWNDHVISPPLVPHSQESDEQHLMQIGLWPLPALPERPHFQRRQQQRILGQDLDTCPTEKLESEPPRLDDDADDLLYRPGTPREQRALRDLPFGLQALHDWWAQQLALRAPDQRQELRVNTWFLDYPQHQRCDEGRLVSLPDDVELWLHQCAEAWMDHIDPNWH